MDLQLNNKLFIVLGATSGFGEAITNLLLAENAVVIGVARTPEPLQIMKNKWGNAFEGLEANVWEPNFCELLMKKLNNRRLEGVVINAGGPPAMSFLTSTITDWDNAYNTVLRWKIEVTKALLPLFQQHNYGRLLYIESASVKQPMENLVLSNAMRLAVTGMVKTASQELANTGITLNILAPGFHETNAIKRIIKNKATTLGITEAEAKNNLVKTIPMQQTGKAADFASLALWMLSPYSAYITGQTISVDGAVVKGIFG